MTKFCTGIRENFRCWATSELTGIFWRFNFLKFEWGLIQVLWRCLLNRCRRVFRLQFVYFKVLKFRCFSWFKNFFLADPSWVRRRDLQLLVHRSKWFRKCWMQCLGHFTFTNPRMRFQGRFKCIRRWIAYDGVHS